MSWETVDGKLVKSWTFPDFATALAFVNRVGAIAEELNHHPDVELGWGRVKLTLWSHDKGRITERDRRLAERIDALSP
jgi:4a-hydroxytetrahydrobiopterin dehydratase